jgi:FtsH-binding integral membrane protein
VALEAWFGVDCPLTVLENRFRISAGGNPYAVSFIGYWLGRFLFYSAPDWIFTLVYTVFGVLVLTTYIIYPPAKRG